MLRAMLQSEEYLAGVVRESAVGDGNGAFEYVYKGKWKTKQVALKKLRHVTPPVFVIPSHYPLPDSE